MINKKNGFTLVELMAVMSISAILITSIYLGLKQGIRILNRTNNLSSIEDSFRNAIVDIKNEVYKSSSENLYIDNIQSYEIEGFEIVEPIILIDNDIDSVLYFKGKKYDDEKYTIEKVYFDKSTIVNNKISVKSSKIIIDQIKDNLLVSINKENVMQVTINEIGSDKENRSYSSLINLNKNNEVIIDFN